MSRWRIKGAGPAFEQSRLRIASAAGVILVAAACAPSASAAIGGEAAGVVGSTVKSVQATAKAALPTATPPMTPPPTAKPAAPPQVPIRPPPRAPSTSPPPHGAPNTSRAPNTSSRPDDGSAALPSGDGIADTARGTVNSVTNAGGETVSGVVTPERSDAAPIAVSPSGPDANATRAAAAGSGSLPSAPISVRANEVAALQRWLARVWPAIALGGGPGGDGVFGLVAGDLLRPAFSAFAGLLGSAPSLPAPADSSPLGHSTSETASEPSPALSPVPPDRGRALYLVALAALLAFMGFAIWREFDVALRPWQHRH